MDTLPNSPFPKGKTIGWSDFAIKRHQPGLGFSYFLGTNTELFEAIQYTWDLRKVGSGSTDINAVCVVPVSTFGFVSSTIMLKDATNIETIVTRRREGEDLFLKTIADGPTVEVRFAKVVLYSKEELKKDTLDGKNYESPYDWEIVCIIASDVDDEPMMPLAMARNELELPGGNPRTYSGKEYARAIAYWSQRVSVRPTK